MLRPETHEYGVLCWLICEVGDGRRGSSRGRTDCEPCVEENEILLCEPMECASTFADQSTSVVAGRGMDQLEGDILDAQWQEC